MDPQQQITEWQADVDELKSLLTQATRKKVKTILNNEIALLENKILSNTPIATIANSPKSSTTTSTSTTSATAQTAQKPPQFKSITSYGFEQTSGEIINNAENDENGENKEKFSDSEKKNSTIEDFGVVRVYISFKTGDAKLCETETQIQLTCTDQSLDLKILNVLEPDQETSSSSSKNSSRSNYRLFISKLDGSIDPNRSIVKTVDYKRNRIILQLTKTSERHWLQLPYRKQVGEDFDVERGDDPARGLIGMMKQLYEEGDEEMKKTIAQTWSHTEKKQQKYAFPSRKEMMRN